MNHSIDFYLDHENTTDNVLMIKVLETVQNVFPDLVVKNYDLMKDDFVASQKFLKEANEGGSEILLTIIEKIMNYEMSRKTFHNYEPFISDIVRILTEIPKTEDRTINDEEIEWLQDGWTIGPKSAR